MPFNKNIRYGLIFSVMLWAGGMVLPCAVIGAETASFWQEMPGQRASSPRDQAQPRQLLLDQVVLSAYLARMQASGQVFDLELPLPEGGFSAFWLSDSGTLPPRLQAKYPQILSFKGADAEGRRVRLDVSARGVQAMVFDTAGVWVVRPDSPAPGSAPYQVYRRNLLAGESTGGVCETDTQPALPMAASRAMSLQTGTVKRTYRVAMAANSQYISRFGGTVTDGLAAVTAVVNRVSGVYERELSIRLILADDNDLLMFADAQNDPFVSNSTSVINDSTIVINEAIGVNHYDLGHVLTTGSGGLATLGVVCNASYKARGTTGLPNPVGDDFYIDYVAHEIGHQFQAGHTFNGRLGSCAGGNRMAGSAYEPGSGSTIMAYAGICLADNLQTHSDPYFHAISLQQIHQYTSGLAGCGVAESNPESPSEIDENSLPPPGKTLPIRTPFLLTAAVTQPETGTRYSWEQWDKGGAAALTEGDTGNNPLFRTYPPRITGERVFPSWSQILGGAPVKGETWPETARDLHFRLTVRNHGEDGEMEVWGSTQSADVALAVTPDAGPFVVNTPGAGVNWVRQSQGVVTWDVANTHLSPIYCTSVDIQLSSDGGQRFSHMLAVGVPNSGSAQVPVPDLNTTQARVRVACSNNVFFNVSPANFTVAEAGVFFHVGGAVQGLLGDGLLLSLNGVDALPIAANGLFQFHSALAAGQGYHVDVATQPDKQHCMVQHASGTMQAEDVTNVEVVCEWLTDIFADGFDAP